MVPSDRVTLVTVFTGRDAQGYPKETTETTVVFADILSAKRAEFYAAMQAGKKIDKTFRLWNADYLLAVKVDAAGNSVEPARVVYGGQTYDITRCYSADTEKMELNCVRRG